MAKSRKISVFELSSSTDDKDAFRTQQLRELISAREMLRSSNMYGIYGGFDVPLEICKAINLINSQIEFITDELELPY